jgi:DNA-binding response OmpR family regulator
MTKNKVLIVEDEEGIREGLAIILADKFDIEFATDGIDGIKKAIRNPPNAILLDLKMPEMDGFQVCKILREDKEFDNVPIIIVSAFNNANERTRVFELGADDYVTKPFDRLELVARLQRKIKKKEVEEADALSENFRLSVEGGLTLDLKNKIATIYKNEIQLSAIEFKLLHLLVINFGELVEREKIIKWVWEKQVVSPRLIDPHILSLRGKISPFTILSVYKKGYLLKFL